MYPYEGALSTPRVIMATAGGRREVDVGATVASLRRDRPNKDDSLDAADIIQELLARLYLISGIAQGSTTANSLPHIAKIAGLWTPHEGKRRFAVDLSADESEKLNPDKVWDDFWAPLLTVDGKPDLELIKRELSDYLFLLDQVPRVYMHVTGGLLSKPNYFASVVNQLHDDYVTSLVDDEIKDRTPKCDGDHGGPRCADPECWNDSPPGQDLLDRMLLAASCDSKHGSGLVIGDKGKASVALRVWCEPEEAKRLIEAHLREGRANDPR